LSTGLGHVVEHRFSAADIDRRKWSGPAIRVQIKTLSSSLISKGQSGWWNLMWRSRGCLLIPMTAPCPQMPP